MEQLTIEGYLFKYSPINSKTGKPYSRQGILWKINKGLSLPDNVKEFKLIGKSYVLTVNK